MSKTITDQFRALCQRAELKATTTFARKRDAEMARHEKRLAELQQERDAEIRKAQAALRAVEGDGEHKWIELKDGDTITMDNGSALAGPNPPDDPPDEVPAAAVPRRAGSPGACRAGAHRGRGDTRS